MQAMISLAPGVSELHNTSTFLDERHIIVSLSTEKSEPS